MDRPFDIRFVEDNWEDDAGRTGTRLEVCEWHGSDAVHLLQRVGGTGVRR